MNLKTSSPSEPAVTAASPRVTLSRWINEPLLPFQELLSAHDVARLTRRPKLVISGLVLLGRFPKRRRYHGRQVGWLRSDVLEWMSDKLTLEGISREASSKCPRRCGRPSSHRPCLAFECRSDCRGAIRRSTQRTMDCQANRRTHRSSRAD
jgi:predicted DNA-binding transcriptional regulator AlpA